MKFTLKKLMTAACVSAAMMALFTPGAAKAQGADGIMAEMTYWAGNFAPRGWAFCDGQLLPIAQNTALFSLMGTMYGGDGRTTFGLPDMRGRALIHVGGSTGPGLTHYRQGDRGGTPTVTLSELQMPFHTHPTDVKASSQSAGGTTPAGAALAESADDMYSESNPALNATLATGSITFANAGASQPHENRTPFLGLSCIIRLEGTYPSRS